MFHRPNNNAFRLLRGTCGSITARPSRVGGGKWRVVMHQPDAEAIAWAGDAVTMAGARLQQVDAAIDLHAPTAADTARVADAVTRCLVHRYRRPQPGAVVKGTRYSTRRRWHGVNVVTYADRPCRFCGRPVVHVEVRVRGSRPIDRLGITPDDAPAAIIRRFVAWRAIDYSALGRAVRRRRLYGANRDAYDAGRRVAGLISRCDGYHGSAAPATQPVMDYAREAGIRNRITVTVPDMPNDYVGMCAKSRLPLEN